MPGKRKKKIKHEQLTISPHELKKHPRNYQEHPDDQIEHIITSIEENGIYRNIVVAEDNTILAGHGVVKATIKMKLKKIPVIRLGIKPDSPQALKILAGDNEISHLSEKDDRKLTEILKEIFDVDKLLGTGYDDQMLANLVMITRPASEIKDFNAAAHWVGMPEYEVQESPLKIVVSFRNDKDMEQFINEILKGKMMSPKAAWWPPKEREDPASLIFEEK